MQLAEDSKDVDVPLEHLGFLNKVEVADLDPQIYYMFVQLVCMTQLKLDDPTDGTPIGVDFQSIFSQIMDLSESKKELILSENPCSKTPHAVVTEVRSFLKKNLP